MNARKGNGTATGAFAVKKSVAKVDLLPPQQKALETLADKSKGLNLEWVEVRGIDPRPVRKLEEKQLIVTDESGPVMHARVTYAGWKQAGLEMPEFMVSTPWPLPDEEDEGDLLEVPDPVPARKPLVKPFDGNGSVPVQGGVREAFPAVEPVVLVQLAEADPRPPVIELPDEPVDDPDEGLSDGMPEFLPVQKPVEYDCGPGCIHEHVMVLLREMYPEIREAAEILRQAKVIERRLGL